MRISSVVILFIAPCLSIPTAHNGHYGNSTCRKTKVAIMYIPSDALEMTRAKSAAVVEALLV